MKISISEIQEIHNPLILPWLDLYETAFPPSERSLVSSHIEDLIRPNTTSTRKKHRLAAVDEEGQLVGIARYTFIPEIPLVYLIYLAIVPERRSRGIGEQLFEEVRLRCQQSYPTLELIGWEVEDPDGTQTADERIAAERRIHFYSRLGARRLYGVDHTIQNRIDLPIVPMYVMATTVPNISFLDLSESTAIDALEQHFRFKPNGETPVSLR